MSYGFRIYGPIINGDSDSSKLVFSDEIRTSNIQLYDTFNLNAGETSSVYQCPDANNSSKILLAFVGSTTYVDIINKTSTGFQLQNTSTLASRSGIVMAMRIS